MSDSATPTFAERLGTVQVGVRAELSVSRHVFGDDAAYVIQDPITFQSHRFSVDDYQVFLALRDDAPLQQIFETLVDAGRLINEQQDDFYRFVLHLNRLGLLSLPVSDGKALYERFRRKATAGKQSRLMRLMFLRVPLFQPDAFLTRTARYANPLFTRTAFIIWLLGVFASVVIIASRWEEFWSPVSTILAIQNLPILWTLLVGLKTFHEFGHAYACKRFGGHVPEMGAFLIIGTPCAYVDATAAWGFSSKLQRVIVSLGGMYFESIAAIIAVFVWNATSPGPLHAAAQYTILLSTAVTVAFNANPLMKYDGYYVLSDLAELPNLRARSQRRFADFVQRWILQLKLDRPQATEPKQRFLLWFGFFSWLYKIVVVIGIAVTIAFKIPAAGIALAFVYVTNAVRQTIVKTTRLIKSLPERRERVKATLKIAALTTAAALFVIAVPVPVATHVHGIVGHEEEFTIHARSSGFLADSPSDDGDYIRKNAVVCRLQNRELVGALETKIAEIDQLRIEAQEQLSQNPSLAISTSKRLENAEREKIEFERSVEHLEIRSPGDGVITKYEILDHDGHFLRKGEPIATVRRGGWVIRTVTTAAQLSATQPDVGDQVTVLLPASPRSEVKGRIVQIAPTGSHQIDDAALTHIGGGKIAVEATTQQAKQPYFELVVEIERGEGLMLNGMTAWVKLSTPSIPIGEYLYRSGLNLLNRLRLAG